MGNVSMKKMTHEKWEFIYRCIEVLLVSVPESLKDIIHTDLLFHAIKLKKKDDDLIFIALRNKKFSLLRGSLKHDILKNSSDIEMGSYESPFCVDELKRVETFNIIMRAYIKFTKVECLFIKYMLFYYDRGKDLNITQISRKIKISKARGGVVLKNIRKKILDAKQEKTNKLMLSLRSFRDLQGALDRYNKS